MPNWCHNYLTVEGDHRDLERFSKQVQVFYIQGPAANELGLPNDYFDSEEACAKEIANIREGIGDTELNLYPEKQPLSFKKIIPEPTYEGYENSGVGETAIDGKPTWFDWRCQHWGTKWDASFKTKPLFALAPIGAEPDPNATEHNSRMTEQVGRLAYKFDTAWVPPEPVVKEASRLHQDLKFILEFGEAGGDFAGRITFKDGHVVDEEELSVEEVLPEEDMWF